MQYIPPTYTAKEAFDLMFELDFEGLIMLGEVINEEKRRYSLNDLRYLKEAYVVAYQLCMLD